MSQREESCCSCRQLAGKLTSGQEPAEPLSLGQVLLVFFLPLACAAGLVIWVLRAWPGLAERPGYLLLAALAVVCVVLILAGILTRKTSRSAENE